MTIFHPLTREERLRVLSNELAARADELIGEWVRVVSSESGPVVGTCFGADRDFIAGVNIFVQTGAGSSGRHIFIDNLVSVDPIEYVPAPGDGSSHGATWEHFLRAVEQAYHSCRGGAGYNPLDELINMSGEGARRDGGGWVVILEHLMDLQSGDPHHLPVAMIELRRVARDFAEREYKCHVAVAQELGQPKPQRPDSLAGARRG